MSRRTPSPADTASPTILSVLQGKNPEVTDQWAGTDYQNTRSNTGSFDLVDFDDEHPAVQKWTDFSFEAIDLAYGDILHQDIKQFELNYQPVQELTNTKSNKITKESSVDRLGYRWSHFVLKTPLTAAATHLRQSLGGYQENPTLEHQEIMWHKPLSKNTSLEPDWVSFSASQGLSYAFFCPFSFSLSSSFPYLSSFIFSPLSYPFSFPPFPPFSPPLPPSFSPFLLLFFSFLFSLSPLLFLPHPLLHFVLHLLLLFLSFYIVFTLSVPYH